jgi:hypothetical protein
MKSKANQIYFKKFTNNSKCDVHTLPKNLIVERLYAWLQFGGGIMCFRLEVHKSKLHWNVPYNKVHFDFLIEYCMFLGLISSFFNQNSMF